MWTIPTDLRVKLKAQLVDDEKYRQFVYPDSRGILTVAVGRNLQSNGISFEEALFLLDNDIMRIERDLGRYGSSWYGTLDGNRQVAILNAAFNLGVGGICGFRDMIACIMTKDWKGASDAMLASEWAKQVGARAIRLAQIMETGVL